jgi:DNA-binding response OmpR family regulator
MSKILIIEDEINTATPVKLALEIEGIDADIAKDGSEGLTLFGQNEYDLVLLDLKMPGMSGEEVLSEIRKVDPFMDVIIYTNYSDFSEIKKLTNIGIEGYINKGPNAELSELIETIKSKLAPLDEFIVGKLIDSLPEENADN